MDDNVKTALVVLCMPSIGIGLSKLGAFPLLVLCGVVGLYWGLYQVFGGWSE